MTHTIHHGDCADVLREYERQADDDLARRRIEAIPMPMALR